ncbi:HNH endonuclease [Actinomadura luteofluorescens]|uniref:HNH endonuclease n=1 Tax=Actinomadura luteofluorescens TaxID=46163 RepID=UPI003D8A2EA7
MKRGKPLTRKGPLRSQSRGKRLRKSKILDPRPDISEQRETVYDRAGGHCDLCGQPLSWSSFQCHHRKKRSQGGDDSLPNLMALHGSCHHDRVHARPKWAYDRGFMVRRDDDPAKTAVLRHGTRWQVPGEDQWEGADAPAGWGAAA